MNTTPKLGKGLGRKRDRKDDRDFAIHGAGLRGGYGGMAFGESSMLDAPLQSHVDVFAGLGLPVYDQGTLGSCTANAGVLYRRFLAQKFSAYSQPDQDLSRLFLYYQERLLPWNNDPQSDGGAAIRDIFYVLSHTGVCPASGDPYIAADFASSEINNSAKDIQAAAAYQVGAYHRIPDVETARACLTSGYAIALGFTVYPSFEEIGPDGMMPMPTAAEQAQSLGGHAVVIRGYDDANSRFKIQNSWSPGWGDGGCFYMPYAFLEDAHISQFDMWMGHLGKPWK